MSAEPFLHESPEDPAVRGWLHHGPGPDGLVLTHGAGSNCDSALLRSLAECFERKGLTVLRCDLPFRQRRPKGPPVGPVAEQDRHGLQAAANVLKTMVRGRIFLGGHSYGGRQATMLAAKERSVADALLLLSYPLHPPRRPEQLRTAHLPDLRTPSLFVHGARDPFGSLEELRSAIAVIPARTDVVGIEGAGHDLARDGQAPYTRICEAFLEFAAAIST